MAYYVKTSSLNYERIAARSESSGLTVAFMVYGMEYRLNDVRGLPIICAVLETIAKLDRYKEATVGSAEERQKIAYTIEHQSYSTGENPLIRTLAKARDANAMTDDVPQDAHGRKLADTVSAATQKQVFNMPPGASLKSLDSKNELYFEPFFTTNINLVTSALHIPPNVAMSMYDASFSASRAALKDWERVLLVKRSDFSCQFYQRVYEFWLDVMILQGKFDAQGYLKARANQNDYILQAYRQARFIGAAVPHIDPLKEVNAERAKLGPLATTIPLTTVEAATEALNCGDSDQNAIQFSEEVLQARQLGLVKDQTERD